MTQFTKKLLALLILDAVTILVAAALLLRGFWQAAVAIIAALSLANIFLGPLVVRTRGSEGQGAYKGWSKLWFWGFALLAATIVRSAFFMQSGFSWPGLVGVIAGTVLGTMFLIIAKKSKGLNRQS